MAGPPSSPSRRISCCSWRRGPTVAWPTELLRVLGTFLLLLISNKPCNENIFCEKFSLSLYSLRSALSYRFRKLPFDSSLQLFLVCWRAGVLETAESADLKEYWRTDWLTDWHESGRHKSTNYEIAMTPNAKFYEMENWAGTNHIIDTEWSVSLRNPSYPRLILCPSYLHLINMCCKYYIV